MQTFSIAKQILGLAVIGQLSVAGYAQPSAISLFSTDTVTVAVLSTDIRSLLKSKYTEADQPAKLQIAHANDTMSYDVEVRCRGNIRKEVCYYPSIRMKFEKKDFTYNKLKWVNMCDGETDEDDLLEEFLAYKLYNILTEKSFDVSLVQMHYKDSGEKDKSFSGYAFVIQNADELAAQFNGRVHEPTVMKESLLNLEQVAIFNFFQYMIGNTDWAFGNRHNVEVFTDPVTNSLIPVAYDFDYSGLVNAQYAVPHESMPITEVTARHNKGFCIDEAVCEKTRQLFLSKKEALLGYCRDFSYLDGKSRNKALDYLEDFFETIDDPKTTQRIFVKECRELN